MPINCQYTNKVLRNSCIWCATGLVRSSRRHKYAEGEIFSGLFFSRSTVGFHSFTWLIESYRISACPLQKTGSQPGFFSPKCGDCPSPPSFITLLAHLRILSLEVNPLIAEKKNTVTPPVWPADVARTKALLFTLGQSDQKICCWSKRPSPLPSFPPMRNSLAEDWQED